MSETELSVTPDAFRAARSGPTTHRIPAADLAPTVLLRERAPAGHTGRWLVARAVEVTSSPPEGHATLVLSWPPSAAADVPTI